MLSKVPSTEVQKPLPTAAPSHSVKNSIYSSTQISVNSVESFVSEKEPQPLPSKRGTRPVRYLRHTFFTMYRRLFSVVFIANAAVLVALLARKYKSSSNTLKLTDVATATSANLMVSILMRQEHVINLLFVICAAVPRCAPLWIRRRFAKVFHFGGLHSSCGTASVMWFLLFTYTITAQYLTTAGADADAAQRDPATLAVTYLIIALLVAILIFAIPRFRIKAHDSFETVHRFAGWSVLLLFWIHTIIMTNASRRQTEDMSSLGHALVMTPTFWFLIVITISIAYPWLRLRKVAVRSEYLSDHAVRMHFNYKMIFCAGIRISDSPLKEWHAFATIPEPDGSGFSLVMSNAGDWTNRQIQRQPSRLWVRGDPTFNVLRCTPLFERIVVVATGSGIGPCLALQNAKPGQCRMIWSTPNPEDTYGKAIIDAVYNVDPQAIIINTRATGRPDLVALAYRLYLEAQAEAIFVVSNQKVTHKLVYGMESRGIPAYGPIWDS
ncbi:hypothetical protein L228DRAFT_208882 [Xylona heveae TC161]|uniref:Integral membrane protein TmpA n=1 Tax=Xylona heveae (strain CBS 132557 / TC161) TaxID=1328760 RepID=A0A165I3R4_XYLHT|nr:hypothetical protein L228DRAFT_208882 [Xylona heveae TC161]KZF24335.1 hypothetical protein L228DRAFT_208882 [Xylona heveae TC161]